MEEKLSAVEQALLGAFASGLSLEEITTTLPEYSDRIKDALENVFHRFTQEDVPHWSKKFRGWVKSPSDIEEAVRNAIKIRGQKQREVKSLRFEEATRLRDQEMAYTFLGSVSHTKLSPEESLQVLEVALDAVVAEEQGLDPLMLIIDPGSATPEEIGELLAEISALYRMIGGSGITFTPSEVKEVEAA